MKVYTFRRVIYKETESKWNLYKFFLHEFYKDLEVENELRFYFERMSKDKGYLSHLK